VHWTAARRRAIARRFVAVAVVHPLIRRDVVRRDVIRHREGRERRSPAGEACFQQRLARNRWALAALVPLALVVRRSVRPIHLAPDTCRRRQPEAAQRVRGVSALRLRDRHHDALLLARPATHRDVAVVRRSDPRPHCTTGQQAAEGAAAARHQAALAAGRLSSRRLSSHGRSRRE